ncbi:MAG: SPOR domain-containing protein [Paracoccaceae bacterium]
MLLKMVPAAVLVVFASFGVAAAQSASDFSGPRELPPSSFTGQQYVDSRGCVFLRAGIGGRTNWVPRVNRNRSQLCGYPPTFGNNQVAIIEPEAKPAPVARVAPTPAPASARAGRKPIDTVASTTTPPRIRTAPAQRKIAVATYTPAPVVFPAARVETQKPKTEPVRRQVAERVPTAGQGKGKIGCYADAPVAERFRLRDGGSVVLCTRGDGDIANAKPPRLLAGAAAVAASGYLEGPDPAARVAVAPKPRLAVSSQDLQKLPKGYKYAFEDDRLNPNRGKGTRQGWEDQDQVWTRDVPARLVAEVSTPKGKTVAVRRLSASTKSEAVMRPAVTATGSNFVQVGTFGQPANADGASVRLSRLGLPVARSKVVRNGAAMQIVLAGPFGSRAAAQAALSKARSAGFDDAFIR